MGKFTTNIEVEVSYTSDRDTISDRTLIHIDEVCLTDNLVDIWHHIKGTLEARLIEEAKEDLEADLADYVPPNADEYIKPKPCETTDSYESRCK